MAPESSPFAAAKNGSASKLDHKILFLTKYITQCSIVLMRHSSGAHLVLLLATDPRYLAPHRLKPSDIAAVIGLSPPVDLRHKEDGRGYGDVLLAGRGADAFNRDPALMKDASPIEHL